MTTRTDALLSQQETGKMTASIDPRCDRLSPGVRSLNALARIEFQCVGVRRSFRPLESAISTTSTAVTVETMLRGLRGVCV